MPAENLGNAETQVGNEEISQQVFTHTSRSFYIHLEWLHRLAQVRGPGYVGKPNRPSNDIVVFKLCCCSSETYLGSPDLLHMYLTLGSTHSITSTIKCRASPPPRKRGVGTERGEQGGGGGDAEIIQSP